jgi:uncharacterized RDD family membrane protein YckC
VPPGQPQWAPGQQQWAPPGQQWPAYGAGGRRFASFWSRFGAAFIDYLILSPFAIIGRIVGSSGKRDIHTCGFDPSRMCESPAGSTVALSLLITLTGLVVAILYYGLLEGRTGQTIGKRALGIMVLDAHTGTPIGVGRAIGRYFGKFLSTAFCLLGYLWMLWDPQKQTWHDKFVSSYVVTT